MDFPSIALLTDFGDRDGFVGVMKGVLLSRLAQPVPIVDISHQIEPQNIRQALWVLGSAYSYFPPKSIFINVVDPGVGCGEQASLLAFWPEREQIFIAPDNGLLTPIYEAAGETLQIVDIRRSALYEQDLLSLHGRSNTFHGRDVYAPIAALTANAFLQDNLTSFLAQFDRLEHAPIQFNRQKPSLIKETHGNLIQGEIIACDHFGNLITNIPNHWAQPGYVYTLKIHGQTSKPCMYQETYSNLSKPHTSSESPLLLIPSSGGTLELALFRGNAQQTLQLSVSDPLILHFTP